MNNEAESIADVFKALGHPARVSFIKLLGKEERCVCDLVDSVDLGWSTVSRHLSVLKDAGIIEDEKRGQQVFYRLKQPCVIGFIECLETNSCHFGEFQRTNCNCK